MKSRTILLVLIIFQLCLLFTVVYETLVSVIINDHPYIFDTNDIFVFDLMLLVASSSSALISTTLIILFIIGHVKIRKMYLVLAFGFNLILFLPFFSSGIYLFINSHNDMQLGFRVENEFSNVITYMNQNATLNNSTRKSTNSPLDSLEFVTKIQRRYCCCGVDNFEKEYNMENETFSFNVSKVIDDSQNFSCPHFSVDKESHCFKKSFIGCGEAINKVYRRKIIIFSSIGLLCTLVFMFSTPFLYGQLELDRRVARANYIREWRKDLDGALLNHRIASDQDGDKPEDDLSTRKSPSQISENIEKDSKKSNKETDSKKEIRSKEEAKSKDDKERMSPEKTEKSKETAEN